MIAKISPFRAEGVVNAPPSKSYAHRFLIAAALKKGKTVIKNVGYSGDVCRTVNCLSALGAKIERFCETVVVYGIDISNNNAVLDVGESGSTLRFLMPVVLALGVNASFICGKRLIERPMDELVETLVMHGGKIVKTSCGYNVSGKIIAGEYSLSGLVSSQFISGLLFALPLLNGKSTIKLENNPVSEGYISMTLSTLEKSGIEYQKIGNKLIIDGNQLFLPPDETVVFGDYSSAAVLLCFGALGFGVTVNGLFDDFQSDKKITEILTESGACVIRINDSVRVLPPKDGVLKAVKVDFASSPDLFPVVCAFCAFLKGESVLCGVSRLKDKESDRLSASMEMLNISGIKTEYKNDVLKIIGGNPRCGTFNGYYDHRMVMAETLIACGGYGVSNITNAESVKKSFPDFFERLAELGGKIDVGV